jgi:NADPH-dependent curcumin reductase CurA
VGAQVDGVKVGDCIIVQAFGGAHGEYRLAEAATVVPVPRATPEILALYISGLTAAMGLELGGGMRSGETVLVTAAAGAAGNFAVQWAKLAGNHVIGTCGSDAKAAWLKQLGCDRAINYRSEDLDAVLTREYPQGIDLAFESVGRQTFDIALRHMAVRGRLVCIGAVAEYERGLDWEVVQDVRIYRHILMTSVSVHGFFLPHYAAQIPEYVAKLLALWEQGKLRAEIDRKEFHGVESVTEAAAYLRSGKNSGKVLVRY